MNLKINKMTKEFYPGISPGQFELREEDTSNNNGASTSEERTESREYPEIPENDSSSGIKQTDLINLLSKFFKHLK
jgi:hypothetical protein